MSEKSLETIVALMEKDFKQVSGTLINVQRVLEELVKSNSKIDLLAQEQLHIKEDVKDLQAKSWQIILAVLIGLANIAITTLDV